MTDKEIADWKVRIDAMDRVELARLRRFAPSGHPVFCTDTELPSYFERRFQTLGGMTSTISKMIGWGKGPRMSDRPD